MILFELKREPEGGAGDAKKFYCPLKILCSPGSEATDYFLSILKIRAYDINITINVKGVTAWFRISHSHKIRFNTKYSLYKSLIVPVLLYGCDTWTHRSGKENQDIREQVLEEAAPDLIQRT